MQRLQGIKRLGAMGLTATALMLGAQGAPRAATLDLSTKPLFLKFGVKPNLLVTLDDSGSMGWDFMPDDRDGDGQERFYSSIYNGVAYNPNVTYEPPLHADGTPFSTSFTDACRNGITSSGCGKDLSTDYVTEDLWGSNQTWPAFYSVFDSSNTNSAATSCNVTNDYADNACYDQVIVSTTSGPGNTDETQNFANWYSFYRSRR
ncbi:MAG: hypothetical protein L0H63_14130, partial [Nitrococcus sp.]|nr:hypothetical protein [Nitrococcus sp.]